MAIAKSFEPRNRERPVAQRTAKTVSEPVRALVVDDDPIARQTVSFALKREGFQCDVAIDGDDAIERFRHTVYSLVVIDLRMPKKNGHALSLELTQHATRPIIVVHSAIDDPRLTRDLMMRGVDDIIYKPTNYAAFAAKMSAMVTRQQHRPKQLPTELPSGEAADASEIQETEHPLISEHGNKIPADAPVPLSDIEEKLLLVQRILPVSKAALDVYEMTKAGCDAIKLGEAIRRDPALAAEVLAIANSNFYNPSGNAVTELDKAVVRIGQRRTGELALAASTLSGMTNRQIAWLDTRTMWRQSIAAGVAVELLVTEGKHGKLGESLGLVAIMHSLGRVVLGTLYPDHYRRLIKQCEKGHETLIDQESQVFPENHAEIMTRLLATWKIPMEIYRPMTHILDPYGTLTHLATPTQTKVELIKLAVFIGQLATRAWHPWDLVEIPPASMLKRLGISDVAGVLEQTRANTQTIIDFQAGTKSGEHERDSLKQVEATGRKIHYGTVSPSPFDFMAELIRNMGIEIVPLSADGPPQASGVVVNGIGATDNDVRSGFAFAEDTKSLLLTDRRGGTSEALSEKRLQLPFSYAGLQAALLERAF